MLNMPLIRENAQVHMGTPVDRGRACGTTQLPIGSAQKPFILNIPEGASMMAAETCTRRCFLCRYEGWGVSLLSLICRTFPSMGLLDIKSLSKDTNKTAFTRLCTNDEMAVRFSCRHTVGYETTC
jgi:hypothetical protein